MIDVVILPPYINVSKIILQKEKLTYIGNITDCPFLYYQDKFKDRDKSR